MKQFTCAAGTYTIDQAINNQTPLGYYDALAQIASRPDLRKDTIMCFHETGIEGLFSELQAITKSEKRMVKTNPYYWTEKCHADSIFTTIKRASGGVPAAGAPVTVGVDKSSHSRGGQFSKPIPERRGYIKELNGQGVNVTTVNTSNPNNHTVTLQPLNNEVLDLTKLPFYTLLIDPLRMYTKGDTECIKTNGWTNDQPTLRKGYIQKFENGYKIHDDEITGYAFDREFTLLRGTDPLTGQIMEYYNIAHLTNKAIADYMDSKNIETLHGIRDDVTQKGFDGLFTTARSQGMFSRYYDPNDGVSLKTNLFNMMKSLRRVNGPKEWLFIYDWSFGRDWSEAIAALVKATVSTQSYKLFGDGGEGDRDFKWYRFKDFEAYDYSFRGYQLNALDTQRYGNFNENFAYVMPATIYYDNNGNEVPPVTYVNIGAAEMSPERKIWVDDTRERGCRFVHLYIQDTYGMEIHCASKTGIWQKARC
jgi:hypothetical protein